MDDIGSRGLCLSQNSAITLKPGLMLNILLRYIGIHSL